MKNNVNFDHSTLLGDVEFTSHWNNDGVFFYSTGHDSNGDGVLVDLPLYFQTSVIT
ncbi:Putative flagellin structural protein [Shigella boydii ATCC 9905]|nr:Putative flagellin structural protein [Shigella boydii ATCC 9905]EFW56566.1 Putative flagellin structural protein [Shigella boydii ATCC 9905]